MIDDPTQPQGPRIPRDAFEENLYREYMQSVLSKWEGTPGLGSVRISVSADREYAKVNPTEDGLFRLTIELSTPDAPVWQDFMNTPTVRGTCWLEPAYNDDRPRVWYHLPAQEGLLFREGQTGYALEGPPGLTFGHQE